MRIADHDKKLDKEKLNLIREHILKHDFDFLFTYKQVALKKSPDIKASVLVKPELKRFRIFVSVENNGSELFNIEIYQGAPSHVILEPLFSSIKWKGEDEIIVTGRNKEVEFRISLKERNVNIVNLTRYDISPTFQRFKADVTKEEKDQAYRDWLHSLPPWAAALIEAEVRRN